MPSDPTPTFADFGFSAPILKAIEDVGYEVPSPIQAQSIPPLMEKRDLLGQAQTGTGKTAAFTLPLLSNLDLKNKSPQILILTPTRELAIQVAEAVKTYSRHLSGVHVLPVYGGQAMDIQLRQLKRGVQVVVGTPGRIQDHLRRRTLQLGGLKSLVLDEADEMLRMGFVEEVEAILEHTPDDKQVALFSATMPAAIKRIAVRHLNNPVEIRIKSKTSTVETVRQRQLQVQGGRKLEALTRILEVEEFSAMLVFVRTKTATAELAEKLEARGYSSSPLNGDMNQNMREKTIDRLRRGTLDIVVATDVAARGIDVERISHVINFDIPYDTEAYVHRIGRTGRAGRKGDAILFVAHREQRMLRAIEKSTRQKIEAMQLPSYEDIADRRATRFKQQISDTLAAESLKHFHKLVSEFQQEQELPLEDVAAALAFMAQKDRPLISDRPASKPNSKQGEKEQSRARSHEGEKRQSRARSSEGEKEQSRARSNDGIPQKREKKPEQERAKQSRPEKDDVPNMELYRIEIGSNDGILAKHIVGAIANEAGVDSTYIGKIDIAEDFSTVFLPDGMPKDIFKHLRRVWLCQKQMRISRVDSANKPAASKNRAKLGLADSEVPAHQRKKPKTKSGKKAPRKPKIR